MPRPPLIAEDRERPRESRPRITIDWDAETVSFEQCHESRRFLSTGAEPIRVCRFDEIQSVTDFLTGNHRGAGTKAVLSAGRLVHSHSTAADLASIFVSTREGRTRVFANWTNFAQLRDALREIVPESSRPPWTEDPRMMPLFVVGMLGVVGVLIYFLL